MPFKTGKKALIAGIVILIAVVPSVWLAMLEFRTNDHLVEEVDRGLRTDAELFIERLAQFIENRLYLEYARGAVERNGYRG
jgi:hypothetical protein